MEEKKRILVVEDEVVLRRALLKKLTIEGFMVLEATDGVEGLEIGLKEQPDLILLDIVMPKMDGLTMLRILRKDEWGKTVPAIILTNLSEIGIFDEEGSEEDHDYLVKSDWKLEDVVLKIKAKLAR